METKIVYVVVSTEKDIYLEQAWLSMYSLKLHTPHAHVLMLVDEYTNSTFEGNRKKALEFCDEVIVVDTPKDLSAKERSRYIKTKARDIVRGDFLFIDTDTIIADNITDIDNIEGDILVVPDLHTDYSHFLWNNSMTQRMKNMYGIDVSSAPYYYNSGVILVKDTPPARLLYKKWHENWKETLKNKNSVFDQPPLFKTDYELGFVIKPLDGVYNCQLLGSVQYLSGAKIIHFYNTQWANNATYSPFFGKRIYEKIKKDGRIDDQIKSKVLNVKGQIESPTIILTGPDFLFFSSSMISTLNKWRSSHRMLYNLFQMECKIVRLLLTAFDLIKRGIIK